MSEHITHPAAVRRLERPTSDRKLAGVAGGLGRYFDLNPNFFRVGFLVLTLLSGAGLLIYLVAAFVMPDEGKDKSLAEQVLADRRDHPWPLVGLAIAGVAAVVLLSHATVWPAAGAGWILVLFAGLAILWASRADRRAGRILRAVLVLAAVFAALAVATVVAAFSWFNISLGDGVGNRLYTPSTATAVKPSYDLGVGYLRLDLSGIGPVTHATHVTAKVDVGELRIIVPRNTAVSVNAHAKVGDLYVLNQHDGGRNIAVTGGTGGGLLVIDATVGAGRVDVIRASN
jgi:phage shock protein PspC (stress-responsive transcriptional regulator)